MSWYQKGKTNLDFTEARDSGWQWHQLGHMQVCISLQTDNHTSTPPLSFLQAGCPSCRPTNSVKALKAVSSKNTCCDAISVCLAGECELSVVFSMTVTTSVQPQPSPQRGRRLDSLCRSLTSSSLVFRTVTTTSCGRGVGL